eukprot:TRINITY_DN2907_c0_g2_i1.p3 TRINITY_DN2907_c0_g2~~TRINITY_DN2907_c0_g2_i1.p3  ORF type:complete len:117 (-),score=54.77 TRINITY_DN2907_c0_g2_i1:160-510(-)
MALYLLQLLQRRHPRWPGVDLLNCHRLYLTALLVSVKLLQDVPHRDLLRAMSAKGGVTSAELVRLELALLFLLRFDLFVSRETFAQFCLANCRVSGELHAFDYRQPERNISEQQSS